MEIPIISPVVRRIASMFSAEEMESKMAVLDHLEAKVVLEYIESKENIPDSSETKSTENLPTKTIVRKSKEQYMKIELSCKDSSRVATFVKDTGYYHIIIAVDKSGSMSGSPMKQLKQALIYILEETITQQNVYLDIFLYDDKIHPLNYNSTNFKEKVENIKAGGLTYFSVVFEKIAALTKQSDKNGKDVRKTVVIFMTDGSDTSGNGRDVNTAKSRCSIKLNQVNHDTVVHVLGFSKDHDFKFLDGIKGLGNKAGLFRYCEPSDGPTGLKEKMAELYDYITSTGKELLDVDTMVSDDMKIVDGTTFTNSKTIRAKVVTVNTNEESNETCGISLEEKRFYAETWVYLANPEIIPELQIKVYADNGKDRNEIPCSVTSIEKAAIKDGFSKVEWALKILERNTDILSAKVGEAVTQKKDLASVEKRLERLQAKVSDTRVYDCKVNKDGRKLLLEQIAEIQAKLDILHKMIAEVRRGESDSVSMLARANDLRYQVEFSKHRRQRLMDQRVRKNMYTMKTAQENLDQITINKEQVEALSENCEEFYMCTLSQMNVKEILFDQIDKEDCIGFGLAVKRAEHVLDEPTSIRLWAVSGTLVSRSSMMDAIEHRINIDGHLMAHGGFNMDNDLGFATVGQSREPINAWLPMYVCESHWLRVKALLKPSLGFFCTLDPLGYNYKQIDVLFQVLGTMIGQLEPSSASEHKLKMIFGFQRLCGAVLKEFDLIKQSMDIIKAFIDSPVGRTKDVIANLFVIIGYLAALPHENIERLFGKTKDERLASLRNLWLSIIAESMRRAATNIYRECSDAKVDGVLHALVTESTNKKEKVATKTQAISKADLLSALKYHMNSGNKAQEVSIPDYCVDTGVDVPEITVPEKNIPSVDKAMELWAQAQCGAIRNKNREDQVKSAKQEVIKWINAGHREIDAAVCGERIADAEDNTEENVNWDHLSGEILQILLQLIQKISGTMHINFGNITGCIAFLEFWLTHQPSFTEIDNNSGIAPETWIQGVKKVLHCIQESRDECNASIATARINISRVQPQQNECITVESTKGTGRGNHSDDGDVSDDAEEWEEYEPEDTPVSLLKKQFEEARSRQPNLGEVLCYVCGTDSRLVTLARGLVCQAIQYHRNAVARVAAAEGSMKDFTAEGAAAETLIMMKITFKKNKEAAIQSALDKVFWQRSNFAMIQAPNAWSFIGYMMNTYKDRGEGIAELLKLFTDPEKATEIPCLEDKIYIIVMGKWKDNPVLNNGNVWMPERKVGKKFEIVIGEDAWGKIEVEMRSSVAIHVYRESDIPNRHKHCNSNPYIPNALRLKLGMPLLKLKTTNNKLRSKLTR